MQQNRPIRILHFVGGMNRGGAETFIMNVYRNINRNKVQFDFVVQTDQKCHYDEEIESMGGRIFPITRPTPTISGLVNYCKALKCILKSAEPIYGIHSHVNFFSGINLYLARKMGFKLRIAHSHSTFGEIYNSLYRKTYSFVMRQLILQNSTHLFGCSNMACEALYGKNLEWGKRVQVIPNAIQLEDFNLDSSVRNKIFEELSLPANSLIVGHIGRFSQPKNHIFLIEVFTELLKRVPNSHLVLVGDGPLIKQIQELVKNLKIEDHVHFLGVRADVAKILGSIDIFLFPSLYEGLPVVLVEAQAAGVPCVISNKITKEVDMGLNLVKYKDLNNNSSQWVDALLDAISLSRPSFNYRELAIKNYGYSIQDLASQLERIYMYDN